MIIRARKKRALVYAIQADSVKIYCYADYFNTQWSIPEKGAILLGSLVFLLPFKGFSYLMPSPNFSLFVAPLGRRQD